MKDKNESPSSYREGETDPVKPLAEYVLGVEREFINSSNRERAIAVEVAEDTFSHVWNNFVHPLQKQLEEYRKGLSTSQGWVSVNERLPERVPNKNYSQVQCLVNKRYEWKRGDNSGVYYQIQILTFNHEHECWDGEDGDDHDCAIDQVTHWMPLPPRPESEQI